MQDNMEWRPIAYISRSLSDTEKIYAQVEKEALAITWACERLSQYLIGLQFTAETEVQVSINAIRDSLPASQTKLQQIAEEQQRDHICQQIVQKGMAQAGGTASTAEALLGAPKLLPL